MITVMSFYFLHNPYSFRVKSSHNHFFLTHQENKGHVSRNCFHPVTAWWSSRLLCGWWCYFPTDLFENRLALYLMLWEIPEVLWIFIHMILKQDPSIFRALRCSPDFQCVWSFQSLTALILEEKLRYHVRGWAGYHSQLQKTPKLDSMTEKLTFKLRIGALITQLSERFTFSL